MKAILLLACLGFWARPAAAQTPMVVTASTFTYSGVRVSTGTPIRIDNWNAGSIYLMNGRSEVLFGVPTGGQTIWWGYDVNVSTSTNVSIPHFGMELLAGNKGDISAGSNVPIYAQTADAAGAGGQVIVVHQAAPKTYHNIPGSP